MYTLKIIFLGLIAFSPQGDDSGTLYLVRARDAHASHYPMVLQKEGSCEANQPCKWPLPLSLPANLCENQLCWLPLDVDLAIEGLNGTGLTLDDTPGRLLDSVPSVAEVIPGPAPLRRSCRQDASDCPVWSRMKLSDGMLSACHFMHMPDKCSNANKLLRFRYGGRESAVANAVLWEASFDSALMLVAKKRSGAEVVRAALTPKDGEVVLIVANEPIARGRTVPSCPIPHDLSHFSSYYRLVDPLCGMFGRSTKRVPRFVGYDAGTPGHCEDEVEWFGEVVTVINSVLSSRNIQIRSFPHGGSECDMATIP